MLGTSPLATLPLASAPVAETEGSFGAGLFPALQGSATGAVVFREGIGVFPALQGYGEGFASVPAGDVAGDFPALTGLAQAYFGSRFRPTRMIPSWQQNEGVVSFDIADVPLIGQADDARQILMGLLHIWEDHYSTMRLPSQRVQLRYEPKNVMPPSRGDNFVWVSAEINVAPGSKEVVDEL